MKNLHDKIHALITIFVFFLSSSVLANPPCESSFTEPPKKETKIAEREAILTERESILTERETISVDSNKESGSYTKLYSATLNGNTKEMLSLLADNRYPLSDLEPLKKLAEENQKTEIVQILSLMINNMNDETSNTESFFSLKIYSKSKMLEGASQLSNELYSAILNGDIKELLSLLQNKEYDLSDLKTLKDFAKDNQQKEMVIILSFMINHTYKKVLKRGEVLIVNIPKKIAEPSLWAFIGFNLAWGYDLMVGF